MDQGWGAQRDIQTPSRGAKCRDLGAIVRKEGGDKAEREFRGTIWLEEGKAEGRQNSRETERGLVDAVAVLEHRRQGPSLAPSQLILFSQNRCRRWHPLSDLCPCPSASGAAGTMSINHCCVPLNNQGYGLGGVAPFHFSPPTTGKMCLHYSRLSNWQLRQSWSSWPCATLSTLFQPTLVGEETPRLC